MKLSSTELNFQQLNLYNIIFSLSAIANLIILSNLAAAIHFDCLQWHRRLNLVSFNK